MMEWFCVWPCLCLSCGREEEASCPRGGALLVWAATWLQTARWHRYKQDLSSGLCSHILILDSTQTLPRFYREATESSRSSVVTALHEVNGAFTVTERWEEAAGSCECGCRIPWDTRKDLLPWGVLTFTMSLLFWCRYWGTRNRRGFVSCLNTVILNYLVLPPPQHNITYTNIIIDIIDK